MALASKATLYYAPRSPFAVKVRILLHELGLADRIVAKAIDPWTNEALREANPLCKVPTLVLEDGSALYDSPVICEYLNWSVEGTIVPPPGPRRWDALRRQALGDGLAEAVIRRVVENMGPRTERSGVVVHRQERAIAAALDALGAEAVTRPDVDIGEVAVAAALAYLTFRSPELDWRRERSNLAMWFDTFSERASVVDATQAFRAA